MLLLYARTHTSTHAHASVLTACCRVLLQHNNTPLHVASVKGHDGVAARLLAAKADVNSKDMVSLWFVGRACGCGCVRGWARARRVCVCVLGVLRSVCEGGLEVECVGVFDLLLMMYE